MFEIGQMGAFARNVSASRRRKSSITELRRCGVHQVNLGQRHQPVPQAHQREDVQVLVGLRHDAVVGGHDENDHVHAVRAGDHVADEIHVARHVHDADDAFVCQPAGSEAEVNRQAALFLLGERVGFAAGQQLHQRALAVVHVPGGAEHDVLAGGGHGGVNSGKTSNFQHPTPNIQ